MAPSTIRALNKSISSVIGNGQRDRNQAAASTVSNSLGRHFYSHRSVFSMILSMQPWYVARLKEIAVPISHCRLTAFVVCSPCSRQHPMVKDAESLLCLIRYSKSFFILASLLSLSGLRNKEGCSCGEYIMDRCLLSITDVLQKQTDWR